MGWTGGCLCGAVRYEVSEPPQKSGFCHCRMCQKVSGAPCSVGVYFTNQAFLISSGQPSFYRSSNVAERGFCRNCGSQLLYRPIGSETIVGNVGSLDRPEDTPPTYHTGVEGEISWLLLDDALPRKCTDDQNFQKFPAEAQMPANPIPKATIGETEIHKGGCLCGAVRYQITGPPLRGTICHCGVCRRISGAPFLAWAIVASAQHSWTSGEPASFRSSQRVIRQFCRTCGSPISFQFDDAISDQIFGVTVGSLDQPEAFPPTRHNWTSRQLPWITFADGLPSNPADAGDEMEAL